MGREDARVVGQFSKLHQTGLQHLRVTARKIAVPHRLIANDVAGKQGARLRLVDTNTAWSLSWGRQYREAEIVHLKNVAIVQIALGSARRDRRHLFVQVFDPYTWVG